MTKKRRWNDLQLREAVKSSFSIRQVLGKLGLVAAGGNYQHLKRIILEQNLDMSHFLGKGWAMGTKFSFKPKIPLEKILVNNTHYQSYKLKDRLFKAGLKTPSCELCG